MRSRGHPRPQGWLSGGCRRRRRQQFYQESRLGKAASPPAGTPKANRMENKVEKQTQIGGERGKTRAEIASCSINRVKHTAMWEVYIFHELPGSPESNGKPTCLTLPQASFGATPTASFLTALTEACL